MTLQQLISLKTTRIIELQEAKADGDDARRRCLADEAASLERQIADRLLAEGRNEDAVVNLVSQASCLMICGKGAEAFRALQQAKGLTTKPRLLKGIESAMAATEPGDVSSYRGDA